MNVETTNEKGSTEDPFEHGLKGSTDGKINGDFATLSANGLTQFQMSQEELTKLKALETMTQVSTAHRNNRDRQHSRANFGVVSCQAEEEHKSDR